MSSSSAVVQDQQQQADVVGVGATTTTTTTTTTLSANELIWIVDKDNNEIRSGIRHEMRQYNLWHRATYCLIIVVGNNNNNNNDNENDDKDDDTTNSSPLLHRHRPTIKNLDTIQVIVQKRSFQKDYCPGKYDALPGGVVEYQESYYDNMVRELDEEMRIRVVPPQKKNNAGDNSTSSNDSNAMIERIFTFPYEDDRVRVWGEFYICYYYGRIEDIIIQVEEVDSIEVKTFQSVVDEMMNTNPDAYMPDAVHAMKLYYQYIHDHSVQRKLLHGYSSGNINDYKLRPYPKVLFLDCDDCLYFDNWTIANMLTAKIDEWCTTRHGLQSGEAYQLYIQYGTALRGLLAEQYIDTTENAINEFLQFCHDVPVREMLQPDWKLRQMLLQIDPSIKKYIFTSSVKDHALRCLQALGIDDLFTDPDSIIDCKVCQFETKHSVKAFEIAMQIAGSTNNPEECIFCDDNRTNIAAARQIGWRSILVGTICRDERIPISSEHAELEITTIHELPMVLPELFIIRKQNDEE